MRIALTACLAIAVWLLATLPCFGQYSNGYTNRKELTIPAAQACTGSSGTLSNHQVLVSRTDTDLRDGVQETNGEDIRFETTGGSKLDHDLEEWVGASGLIRAWVEVDTVNCGADTDFYVYYNKSGQTAEQNVTGTWPTSKWSGAWHMEDDPSTTDIQDLTSNNGDLVTQGTWLAGQSVTGQVGNGIDCDDSGTQFLAGPNLTPAAMTIFVWMQGDQTNAITELAVTYDGGSSVTWAAVGKDEGSGRGTFWVVTNDFSYGDSTDPSGAWVFFAATANSTTRQLFVNGTAETSDATGLTYGGFGDTRIEVCGEGGLSWDGIVDEIWLANSVLTENEIITWYRNMNAPGTFLTAGSEETASSGTVLNSVVVF